ncbi:MAG TPA: hydroxyisourate hydrolase [Vicinamibacteria bacterium]|nr:hydroxyisourate hydrolase [Vicinamibacteria bacterium]
MSPITTHVLDTSVGRPAAGIGVCLETAEGEIFSEVARGRTDDDGRCRDLLPAGTALTRGVYRLTFDTGAYFAGRGVATFFPRVAIVFQVSEPTQHHHVPLLLSPFGYSTYRGS